MESIVFKYNPGQDASDFPEHVKAIANHVGVTFKYGAMDAANAVRTMKDPVFEKPVLPDNATDDNRMIHEFKFEELRSK